MQCKRKTESSQQIFRYPNRVRLIIVFEWVYCVRVCVCACASVNCYILQIQKQTTVQRCYIYLFKKVISVVIKIRWFLLLWLKKVWFFKTNTVYCAWCAMIGWHNISHSSIDSFCWLVLSVNWVCPGKIIGTNCKIAATWKVDICRTLDKHK